MLCNCSTGLVPLMKKLIERMPDVVVVGDERATTLLRYTQCGLHVSRKCFEGNDAKREWNNPSSM